MSDEAVHYMESTSRLRAENEELRQRLESRLHEADLVTSEHHIHVIKSLVAERKAAEAIMREVAEELRRLVAGDYMAIAPDLLGQDILAQANRLDPPPVVDKPPA